VKNINVYYDSDLPIENSNPIIKCIIAPEKDTDDFYNINISDINVNGKSFKI